MVSYYSAPSALNASSTTFSIASTTTTAPTALINSLLQCYNVGETINIIFIPLAIVVLYALIKDDCGLGKSIRVYYILLAAFDLITLISYHFIIHYLDYVITVLYAIPLNVHNYNIVACKGLRALWVLGDCMTNWLYAGIAADRLSTVRNPLESMNTRPMLRVGLVTVLSTLPSLLVTIFVMVMYTPTVLSGLDTKCQPASSPQSMVYTFRVVILFGLYVTPVVLSAALTSTLATTLLRAGRKRAGMVANAESIAAKEKRSAVTLILIASIHLFFWIPAGLLNLLYSVAQVSPTPFLTTVSVWVLLGGVGLTFTGIPHFINFFVYFARIPGFRAVVMCKTLDKK